MRLNGVEADFWNSLRPLTGMMWEIVWFTEWRIPGEGDGFSLGYFEFEKPTGSPRDGDYVVENNNIKYTDYNEHFFQWFPDLFYNHTLTS